MPTYIHNTYTHTHIHTHTHRGTEYSKSLNNKEHFYQGDKKEAFRDKTAKKCT